MRKIFSSFFVPCFFVCFCGGIVVASAQTTATLGEKSIGTTGCTNSAAAADFDALAQCSSTTSVVGTMQKSPLFVGAVTAPPYEATTCDSTKTGMIQFTSSQGFSRCDGAAWGDLKRFEPVAGTLMPDGTIYAGHGLFTTPCDLGQSGTQASCTGTRSTTIFMTTVATCLALTSYGHNDWYLPNFIELYSIQPNLPVIGGYSTGSNYQTSSLDVYYSATTGTTVLQIEVIYPSGAGNYVMATDVTGYARCVRR